MGSNSESEKGEVPPLVTGNDPSWKGFLLGYSGGFVHVLVSHPLDSVKVRMQTGSTQFLFRNLFKGLTPALIGTPVTWAVNFYFYNLSLNALQRIYPQLDSDMSKSAKCLDANPPLAHVLCAGALSGFTWAAVVNPFEVFKCYAQKHHINTLSAVRAISREVGLRHAMYRGFDYCLLRDIPMCSVYFGVLHLFRTRVPNYADSTLLLPFLNGCMCHMTSWIIGLPFDSVKTHLQTNFDDVTNAKCPKVSMRSLVQTNGFRALFKGLVPTLMRGPIAAGCSIVGVEYVAKYLRTIDSANSQ